MLLSSVFKKGTKWSVLFWNTIYLFSLNCCYLKFRDDRNTELFCKTSYEDDWTWIVFIYLRAGSCFVWAAVTFYKWSLISEWCNEYFWIFSWLRSIWMFCWEDSFFEFLFYKNIILKQTWPVMKSKRMSWSFFVCLFTSSSFCISSWLQYLKSGVWFGPPTNVPVMLNSILIIVALQQGTMIFWCTETCNSKCDLSTQLWPFLQMSFCNELKTNDTVSFLIKCSAFIYLGHSLLSSTGQSEESCCGLCLII